MDKELTLALLLVATTFDQHKQGKAKKRIFILADAHFKVMSGGDNEQQKQQVVMTSALPASTRPPPQIVLTATTTTATEKKGPLSAENTATAAPSENSFSTAKGSSSNNSTSIASLHRFNNAASAEETAKLRRSTTDLRRMIASGVEPEEPFPSQRFQDDASNDKRPKSPSSFAEKNPKAPSQHPTKEEAGERRPTEEPPWIVLEERLAQASPVSHYLGIPVQTEYTRTMLPIQQQQQDPPHHKKAASKDPSQPQRQQQQQARSQWEPTRICQYRLGKTLGKGSTGKVKLAMDIRSGRQVAIKIVPRLRTIRGQRSSESIVSRERRILREAGVLYLLEHPGIVRLLDLVIEDDFFGLVFELVRGEELLEHVLARGRLTEGRARHFMRQLVSAVSYCHEWGVVHRDLKIENVLVVTLPTPFSGSNTGNGKTSNSNTGNTTGCLSPKNLLHRPPRPDIRLVDFGLCNFFHAQDEEDQEKLLRTFCGSLYFAAPELLAGQPYTGPEVDVWSLGVILYVMVVGSVPFDDNSIGALHSRIKRGTFTIPHHVSLDAQDLLRGMICVDPQRRMTMSQVGEHPWLMADCSKADALVPERRGRVLPLETPLDGRVIEHLCRDFGAFQFGGRDAIEGVLREGSDPLGWRRVRGHPLPRLYRLALQRQLKREEEQEASRKQASMEEDPRKNCYTMVQMSRSDGALQLDSEIARNARLGAAATAPGKGHSLPRITPVRQPDLLGEDVGGTTTTTPQAQASSSTPPQHDLPQSNFAAIRQKNRPVHRHTRDPDDDAAIPSNSDQPRHHRRVEERDIIISSDTEATNTTPRPKPKVTADQNENTTSSLASHQSSTSKGHSKSAVAWIRAVISKKRCSIQ